MANTVLCGSISYEHYNLTDKFEIGNVGIV